MPSAFKTPRARASRPRCAITSRSRIVSFCRLGSRDSTECDGAGTIAADGNPQHIAAVIRLRFEPHVCRYSIKAERAAAVDDDGDFRRQPF